MSGCFTSIKIISPKLDTHGRVMYGTYMIIYAIEEQYEGVQSLYTTREAAEAALATDRYDSEYAAYFITEWTVQ
jgi:hypothetical protein